MAYTEDVKSRSLEADDTVAKTVGVPGFPGSVEPNIGTQYTFMALDETKKDTVTLASGAAGEKVVGVALSKAQHVGTPVTVAYAGRVPIQAGAALTYGEYVKPGPDGQAVVGAVTDGIGFVVEAASAKGVLATIELTLGR